MQLSEKWDYKGDMRQTNSFGLISFWLGQPEGEEEKGEKKRKRRKKRKKKKEKEKKVCFYLGIKCIWISRLFGMDYWTFIWISMVLGFLI